MQTLKTTTRNAPLPGSLTSAAAIQQVRAHLTPQPFAIHYRLGSEGHTYHFEATQHQITQAYTIAENTATTTEPLDVEQLMNSPIGYKICQSVGMQLNDTPQQRAVVIDKPHEGKSAQKSYQHGQQVGEFWEKIPRTPFLQRVFERSLLALGILR